MTHLHTILGVSPGVSEDEIKEAYHELVKVWHPDRFPDDPKLQKKAEEKLQQINDAYNQLLNPPVEVTPSATFTATQESGPLPYKQLRFRSPLVLFAVIGIGLAALLYVGLRSSVNQAPIDPSVFSQQSAPIPRGTMYQYWLQSASGKDFFIIEGPRVPLDWEIEALVDAYSAQGTPRRKQSLAGFSISQSMKPANTGMIYLQYRTREK